MQIIAHRKNSIEELQTTDTSLGIEVDIRSQSKDLIIHHDPFHEGVNFEEWIKAYNHKTLILNVKEEGLEKRLIELMNEHKINDFFFLDQSFPFLVKTSKKLAESRCAVRVSEFESIDTALSLTGYVDWVWVDVFTKLPIDKKQFEQLKNAGFKLCLVSPELQQHPKELTEEIQNYLQENEMNFDAVCTKNPESWK